MDTMFAITVQNLCLFGVAMQYRVLVAWHLFRTCIPPHVIR